MSNHDDKRFQSMHTAPMFKKTNKKKQKTKLDDRFSKLLHDKKFKTKSSIDKYGRNNHKDDSVDELNDFYIIEEKSDDNINKPTTEKKTKPDTRLEYLNKLARGEVSETESESDDSDTNSQSNDDDLEEDEIIENKLSLIGQELNPDEEDLVEDIPSTNRLAIMNCDWENVKAVDLMAILQSFCPTGKQVIRVTVYPSDLGLSQMQHEQLHGPQLWDTQSDDDVNSETVYDLVESSEVNRSKSGDFIRKDKAIGIVLHDELVKRGKAIPDNDDSINNDVNIDEERLRSYELKKLKYYFAIAETDSSETSDILRNNLDGVELEHSSMVLDLRIVPEELDLRERTVRDSCDFVPSTYEPPEFIVNALQHTKVECTWEIGETQREKKLTNFALWKNLQESDLQQYIADSDSEAENETDQHKVKNVRKLLLGDDAEYSDDNSTSNINRNSTNNDDFFLEENDDVRDVDKSLTFVPADHTDDIKHKSEEEETVLERELRIQQELRKKRKEKKKQTDSQMNKIENTSASIEQLELLFADNDQNEDEDYDMIQLRKTQKQNNKLTDKLTSTKKKKKIEKKLKKDQSSSNDFVVDVNDSRFKPVFEGNNSKFGIDKTSHEYKETAGMKTILSIQQIKRNEREKYTDVNKNDDIDNNVSANNKIDNKLLHNIKRKFSQVN